jgi:hypothetical protein
MLLTKNNIYIDGKLSNKTDIVEIPNPKPNSNLLGLKLWLTVYNLAKKNPDSSYQAWLEKKPNRKKRLHKILSKKQTQRLGESFLVSGWSNFFKEIGEKPQLIDDAKLTPPKNV